MSSAGPSRISRNKFINSQRASNVARPAKVPYREIVEERPQSGKLQEEKKKQLLGILEKEKSKEKRQRVSYVLVQRMVAKFGVKYQGIIVFLVDDYFSNHEEITVEDLNSLEKEVRNAIIAKIDKEKIVNDKKASNANSRQATAASEKVELDDAVTRPISGREWEVLNVYQSIKDEEKIRKERELAHRKKMQFRKALDDHVEEAKHLSKLENDDDRRYYEGVMKDLDKYNEEEQRKREMIRKKHHDELEGRKTQIDEQRRRADEEKQTLRRMEQLNLQLAQEQIDKENEKVKAIRQREQTNLERVKMENENNQRLRAVMKEKEAAEDHRLMREMAAKLDREEKEREEAFANRMKVMEKFGAKFATEGAGKAMRDEQIRFEQQLLREQQKKEEADHKAEMLKSENRRRRLQEQLNENRRQLQMRKLSAEEEKKRDNELAEQYRKEIDAFQRDEDAKRKAFKEKQAEYRRVLDVQIDEYKRSDVNLTGITTVERKINMPLLKDAAVNPQIKSKLLSHQRTNTAGGNKK